MKFLRRSESGQQVRRIAALGADFFADCIRAFAGPQRDAALVLDERGKVLYCNPEGASIFGHAPDQLVGRPLSNFVLNSELNAWSPAGNLAYAKFAGKRNQWREYCVLDAHGRGARVEMLLDTMVVELQPLLLLWLRRPGQVRRTIERESQPSVH